MGAFCYGRSAPSRARGLDHMWIFAMPFMFPTRNAFTYVWAVCVRVDSTRNRFIKRPWHVSTPTPIVFHEYSRRRSFLFRRLNSIAFREGIIQTLWSFRLDFGSGFCASPLSCFHGCVPLAFQRRVKGLQLLLV